MPQQNQLTDFFLENETHAEFLLTCTARQMRFNLLSFQERIQNHSFLFWNQNEKTAISSGRQTFA